MEKAHKIGQVPWRCSKHHYRLEEGRGRSGMWNKSHEGHLLSLLFINGETIPRHWSVYQLIDGYLSTGSTSQTCYSTHWGALVNSGNLLGRLTESSSWRCRSTDVSSLCIYRSFKYLSRDPSGSATGMKKQALRTPPKSEGTPYIADSKHWFPWRILWE